MTSKTADEVLLTRRDARRIAMLAQRLDAASIEAEPGVDDTVAALGVLNLDWTPTIAPGHDHILYTRIGAGYDPDDLWNAVQVERSLFELDLALRPASALPLYRPVLRDWPPYGDWREWLDDNEPFRDDVLERLELDGPLAATEIEDTSIRPWRSTGWTNGKNVVRMLDSLERRGEIAVADRVGVIRRYDLASRVHPRGLPDVDDATAAAGRMRALLSARGISRTRVGGSEFEHARRVEGGVPARVEGVKGTWHVDTGALERLPDFRGITALLNPLDRLVFDRTRLAELFETEYTLEMYKPKAKRRWGYFALPILHGDRIVGKLDATVERDAGRLRVDAVHEDEPFDTATTAAVRREIRALADWLRVRVELD